MITIQVFLPELRILILYSTGMRYCAGRTCRVTRENWDELAPTRTAYGHHVKAPLSRMANLATTYFLLHFLKIILSFFFQHWVHF